MSATVKCNKCGRKAFARILEDDYTTGAFECEPDWTDEDWQSVQIDGRVYFYEEDDIECLLWLEPCQHDDFDVIEVNYDDD